MKQIRKIVMMLVMLMLMAGPVQAASLASTPDAANPAAPLTAVGVLQYQSRQQVALGADGVIQSVAVRVGDVVKQGDVLVKLDPTRLDWAVQRAELSLKSAQLSLEALKGKQALNESGIALAEANLLAAQENLAAVEAGPSKEQLTAAESRAVAAWAAYNELKEGPTQAQLDQLKANLEKARINLQQAQRAYDKVAWQPDVGASDQAAALQRATIDFQAAQGAFTQATTVSKSALASALSSAQDAQFALDQLRKKPTAADVASAKANVASAEAALAQAKQSPAIDMQLAEVSVQQAKIDLDAARLVRDNAQVRAPVDGVVLAVLVNQGDFGSTGAPAATLAKADDLKLVVDIEQKDIMRVRLGQEVGISVFAVPDQPLKGTVEAIAPESILRGGVTAFPVTIRLEGDSMTKYRAGMTANVIFPGK